MDPEKSGSNTGGDGDANFSTFMSQPSSTLEQITNPGSSPAKSGERMEGSKPANKRRRSELEQENGEGGGKDSQSDVDENMSDEGEGGKGKAETSEDEKGKKERMFREREEALDDVIAKSMAHFHDVEEKLQGDFHKNRRNEGYNDGFLVGGLIFSGWMPSFESIANAIRSIGISDKDLNPIGNTSTLKLLVEIRVTTRERVEAIGGIIRRGAQKIADHMKRSFKWRDLRWVDHWTVILKGIPVNWGEEEIKRVLFVEGRFPFGSLDAIGRPGTDVLGKVGGSTLLLRYSVIPMALLGLHLADPSKLRVKVSKKKTLSWAFGTHPWGYDDAHRCEYCMTTHPDRLECPLEEVVKRESWNAVAATMEMENTVLEDDNVTIARILYTVEKDYNMDLEHIPVRRPTFTPSAAFAGMTSSSQTSSTSTTNPPSAVNTALQTASTSSQPPTPPPAPQLPVPTVAPASFLAHEELNATYELPGQQHKFQRKGAWNFPHQEDGRRGSGIWRGGGRGK
jgi:hypothetical protein